MDINYRRNMDGYIFDSVSGGQFALEQEQYEKELLDMDAAFENRLEEIKQSFVPTYTPIQILSKCNEALSKESDLFGTVIRLSGIYKIGNGTRYSLGYYYDKLVDLNTNSVVLNLLVNDFVREKLNTDSHVVLNGMMTKREDGGRSGISVFFRVDSIVEEVESKVITEDDIKRISLIQKKNEKGIKPIKSILRSKLMRNEKPQICLVYAHTSIVDQDFDKAVKSASSQIDFFTVKDVTFSNTSALIQKLKILDDSQKYDAICLVRGGGSGMDKLDDVKLLECIVGLNTPIMAGLGHVGEGYSIKSVVDENVGTPSLLGQYFDNLVKETSLEREGTINDLAKKMEVKYKPQMDRLAELEKITKSDKEKIDLLLKEKKTDIDNYTAVNKKLIDIQSKVDMNIRDVENRMKGQILIWRIISIVSLIILGILAYKYGQTQLWWN